VVRRLRDAPFRPSWEHRVERLANTDDLSPERLDAIGAQGWELAAVTPAGDGLVLVFERQRGSAC
jgi:hypothetical protein